MPVERSFRAMGSSCNVLAYGVDPTAVDLAVARVEDLERRWSRFRPDSEISRLNEAPDRLTVVSPETFLLVRRAVDAWRLTDGLFDPTLLPALRSLGYDRSFELLDTSGASIDENTSTAERRQHPDGQPTPGCDGIELFEAIPAVVLPPGVTIDPGGIGKGLAADLVAEQLLEAGARGVAVDIGGDVRVAGAAPAPEGWRIDVEDSRQAGAILASVWIDDGGLATSSILRRRWRTGHAENAHHLLDPSTGQPVVGDLVQVSVVAGETWWAEVLTKVVFTARATAGAAPPNVFGCRVLSLDTEGQLEDSAEEVAA